MSRTLTLTAMAALLALPVLAQDATPGFIPVPGTDTKIHVYGNASLFAEYDLNQAQGAGGGLTGGGSNFNPGPAAQTGAFYMSSQDSTVGFATITSSAALGDITTKVEFDFNKTGSVADYTTGGGSRQMFHYRYANLGFQGWTFGMQDSLYSDPDAGLNAIDQNGFPNTNWGTGRLVAVRKDFKVDDKNTIGVALEENMNQGDYSAAPAYANFSVVGTATGGAALNKYPSLVAAWTMADSWGHVRVSALEQYYGIRYYQNGGFTTSSTWEGAFAAGFKVNLGKDNVSGTIYTGKGLGQYGFGSSDNAVYTVATNNWSFLSETGYTLSYTHAWTDTYASSVGLCGIAFSSDPNNVTAAQTAASTDVKSYLGAYVSLTDQLAKNLSWGVEYKYESIKAFGTNVTVDSNDVPNNKNTVSESMLTFRITATY